jgi:hypothetical protein
VTTARALDDFKWPIVPRVVQVDDIRVDSSYQRDLKQAWVTEFVKGFDPSQVLVVVLSARDGSLWAIDGQHRIVGLRELGIRTVWAMVHEGLSRDQEATLFRQLDTRRRGLNAWDDFKAALVAGDQTAVMIDQTVRAAGYELGRSPHQHHLQAIGAVHRIFRLGGARLLAETLELVIQMEQIDRQATVGQVMEGVATFLWSYRESEVFARDRLVRTLMTRPSGSLLGKARALAREMRDEENVHLSSSYVSRAIAFYYNQGLLKKNQLAPRLISAKGKTYPRALVLRKLPTAKA